MNELLQRHPELNDIYDIEQYNTYRHLDEDGNILEFWEKKDGHWTDVTARKKAEQAVAKAQEEVEKARKKAQQRADIVRAVEKDEGWAHEEDDYEYDYNYED